MVIKAEMAIALYCQQCGKLHINKISYFSLRSELKLLKCSCGNNLATLTQNDNKRLKLRIWCNLCQMFQEKIYLIKDFYNISVEKIYCEKENFELGYLGSEQEIKNIVDFNKSQFIKSDCLENECDLAQVEKQHILLEALNRVHDIAEEGLLSCCCGSMNITADITDDNLILECKDCGGFYILTAQTEEDLEKLSELETIELKHGNILVKNID